MIPPEAKESMDKNKIGLKGTFADYVSYQADIHSVFETHMIKIELYFRTTENTNCCWTPIHEPAAKEDLRPVC